MASKSCKISLYADDTNIFIVEKDIDSLFSLGNTVANDIYQWSTCNKLTINFDKTNFMLFKHSSLSCSKIDLSNYNVYMNNVRLSRTNCVKYLGVMLDDGLSWKYHIDNLCNKISGLISIFYHRRHLLTPACRKTLYFSLIHSHLIYCVEIYGSANSKLLKPLILKCNTILRILQDKPRTTSLRELYSCYQTLPVTYLYNLSVLKILHKYVYNCSALPSAICSMFFSNSYFHNYNTRSKDHLSVPVNKNKSIACVGPSMWTNLPFHIRSCSSFNKFIQLCMCQFTQLI